MLASNLSDSSEGNAIGVVIVLHKVM
jgi:hypothetical protein